MKHRDYSSVREALSSHVPERREIDPDWEDVLALEGLLTLERPEREKRRLGFLRATGTPQTGARRRVSRRTLIIAFVSLIALIGSALAIGAKLGLLYPWDGDQTIYGPQMPQGGYESSGFGQVPQANDPAGDVGVVATGNWSGHDWVLAAYVSRGGDVCDGIQFEKSLDVNAFVRPAAPGLSPPACTPMRVLHPDLAWSTEALLTPIDYHQGIVGNLPFYEDEAQTQPEYVVGPVVDEARVVRIGLYGGTVVETNTVPAPAALDLPMRFFYSALPCGGFVVHVEARDKKGSIIDQVSTPLSPDELRRYQETQARCAGTTLPPDTTSTAAAPQSQAPGGFSSSGAP